MNPSVQLVAGFEKALCEPVTIDHGAFAQHSVKPNFIIEAENGSLSLPVVFGKHPRRLSLLMKTLAPSGEDEMPRNAWPCHKQSDQVP